MHAHPDFLTVLPLCDTTSHLDLVPPGLSLDGSAALPLPASGHPSSLHGSNYSYGSQPMAVPSATVSSGAVPSASRAGVAGPGVMSGVDDDSMEPNDLTIDITDDTHPTDYMLDQASLMMQDPAMVQVI